MSDKYEEVTQAILSMLEKGVAPWRKPWSALVEGPRNAFSRRPYRGINVWLLLANEYSDPRWATFNQIAKAGGSVRRGEHGTRIYFFKPLSVKDKREGHEGQTRTVPLLQQFVVFNVEQADGLELPPVFIPQGERNPIEAAEAIVEGMPQRPPIFWDGGAEAYYVPAKDEVHMPRRDQFTSDEGVYDVLFHELVHSTKHETRLKRDFGGTTHSGSDSYGREELVAEMGGSFLCAEAGITTEFENNASYISGWMRSIRADARMVVVAAGAAQKAADFILGRKEEPHD